MNHIDLINTFFEGGGAILCWLNVLKLRRDREIKGVFWPVQFFWSAWGVWNVLYYGAVGHPFSQAAGIVLVSGNITWTATAVRLWWSKRSAAITVPAGVEIDLEALANGQNAKFFRQCDSCGGTWTV